MAYTPVKSNAGTVQFSIINRVTSTVIKSFTIDVFNYSDNMQDSTLNEIFNNANYGLTENYFGARKAISFSLVNNYQNPEYRQKILWLITMINDINNNPEIYKLTIMYRYPSVNFIIHDAIQVGNIKLIETSVSSNSAQELPFEFIDKSINDNVYGYGFFNPAVNLITDYCVFDIDIYSANTFYTYIGSGSITNINNYIPSSIGDNVNLIVARNHMLGTEIHLITVNMNNCLTLGLSNTLSLCLVNKAGMSWKYSINGIDSPSTLAIINAGTKITLSITGKFTYNSELMHAYNSSYSIPSMYGNKPDNYYGFVSGLRYLSSQVNLTSLKVRSICDAVSAGDRFYVENNGTPTIAYGAIVPSHYFAGNSTANIEIYGFQIYNLPTGDTVAQTKTKVSAINVASMSRYGVA